jgi:translation initiation factor 6
MSKINLGGGGYVGAFATATEKYLFVSKNAEHGDSLRAAKALGVDAVPLSISSSELVGILCRANSNGILVSNLIEERELEHLKSLGLGINVGVLESDLNAIGNNVLANDRIAIINPEYGQADIMRIREVLGVEVIKQSIGGFRTVGANNILTNRGFVINNRSEDEEKDRIDSLLGFESTRTTANTGSLSIGISAVANGRGLVVGEETTGFELARIMEGLNID